MSTLTFTENAEIRFKARAGQVNIDQAKGIVECFVAAIGNKDSVGDIIIPGAFDGSLKRRKPRVVWGHNWNCLLYTSPSPRDLSTSRMPSSA